MAYWGWALSLGPNLNLWMQPEVVSAAYAAMQKAVTLQDGATPREQALIAAAVARFSNDPSAD
jgi:hypothetical protein